MHALRHGADVTATMLRILDEAEVKASQIDWSGLWQDPTPQEAPPVDPGTDDVLTGRAAPERLPRPRPRVLDTSCFPAASNAINVLAHTVNTETDGGGPLSLNPVVAVALMLMQVNAYRAADWQALGTWTRSGLTPATLPALSSRPDLMALAEVVLDSFCRAPQDPLSALTEAVPELAAAPCLSEIANNPEARFEISIHASRADELLTARNRDGQLSYPLRCVLTDPASGRAVVVGGRDITSAHVDYQCAVGTRAVFDNRPNEANRPFAVGTSFGCTSCSATSAWWWLVPSGLSQAQLDDISAISGESAVPVSCQEVMIQV